MAVSGIISSKALSKAKKKNQTKLRFTATWRDKSPSNYQRNTLYQIRVFLEAQKNTRRKNVFDTLLQRFNLSVETRRIYKGGGVGSWTWLPRRGCIRLQVGASQIDSRKQCFPYAPCVEIFDIWHSK